MSKPGSVPLSDTLLLGTEDGQSRINVRVIASAVWACGAANCTCAGKTGGSNVS
jgi:hypothetical protein